MIIKYHECTSNEEKEGLANQIYAGPVNKPIPCTKKIFKNLFEIYLHERNYHSYELNGCIGFESYAVECTYIHVGHRMVIAVGKRFQTGSKR